MNNPTIDGVSRKALEQALLAMKRIYQAGYDRILEAGGQCDTPEYMMAGDPTARELRALLDAPATGICRDCFTEQPIGRSCVTCEKIEGERKPVEQQELASPLSDIGQAQLLAICRGAAQRCEEQHAYMASASSDPHNWFPHKWVMDAMRSLLQINASSQRSTIAGLQARIAELGSGSKPVLIQAVAVTRDDEDEGLRLEWLLEGGISELEFAGQVLFAMPEANGLCDETGSAEVYTAPPAPVVAVPEDYCIMPKRLTAENGAKALLLGEFKVTVTNECSECAELDEPNEYCEICDGEGEYAQSHTISWDQIKFIYSKAVQGLSLNLPLRAGLPQAHIAVAFPSAEEISVMLTKAARQADLTPGANYYTAAELSALALVDKIKELNPPTSPFGE